VISFIVNVDFNHSEALMKRKSDWGITDGFALSAFSSKNVKISFVTASRSEDVK